MKIDLHCHTKKTKKSDGINRNVDVVTFSKYMKDLDIKIVAITNHNLFDKKQYEEFAESVKDYTMVWPGIELDINQQPEKNGHMIVICDPNQYKEFDEIINKGIDDVENYSITLKELWEKTKKINCIYIAHYYRKKPEIKEKELINFKNCGIEDYRIFKEPSNYRTLGVFATFNNNVIIGTDVQDWNKYKECNFSELKLPVDSFEQFLLLSKKESTIINTLLNKKGKEKFPLKPHSSVTIEIELYKDINVIFGDKGTGKTEMLKSLEQYMKNNNYNVITYYGNEKDSEFDNIIKIDTYSIDDSGIYVENLKPYFTFISDWKDINPTNLEDYIEWYQTKDNNKNKQSLNICKLFGDQTYSDKKYKEYALRYSKILEMVKFFNLYDYSDLIGSEEFNKFKEIIASMESFERKNKEDEWVEQESKILSNKTIDEVKKISTQYAQSKSVPSEAGIFKFINNRIELKKSLEKIIKALNNNDVIKKDYLGNLAEKGNIYKYTRFKYLDSNGEKSKADEYKTGTIQNLRNYKNLLANALDNIYTDKLIECIKEIQEFDFKVIDGKEFIGVSKFVGDENGNIYKPSQGEKSMLLLNMRLNSESDNYILDEPELSLGNQYISDVIVPHLINIANANKRIVIATHNANIAVRTLPYLSIFRKHNNGVYNTYLGNPFTNKLIENLDKSELDWKEESLNILEGGEEAFGERSYIYDAGTR